MLRMSSDEYSTTNKRTRASGEVLDYLLQEFENNHNPSPEQRKEISDKTNMTEKAVRIWFQNRRAKLRKFERMGKSAGSKVGGGGGGGSSMHSSRSNSFSVSEGQISPKKWAAASTTSMTASSTSPSTNVQKIPIEVNDRYCFVDCSSLSVGSWQRIKSGYHEEPLLRNSLVNLSPFTLNKVMAHADLLVLLSKKNLEINYFFSAMSNNSKILFRIFYPIASILSCSLLDNNIDKGNNELRVSLSHQPKFSVYFFNGVNGNSNQWSICEDFSEGQQVASAYYNENGTSIPHVLVGIKSSLQFLNAFILENGHISPPSANYHPHIQLNDPPNLDNAATTSGNLQFTTDPDLNMWNNGTRSPIGLDLDPSPNSVTSSTNPNSNIFANEENLPSSTQSQTSDQNEPYGEIFTAHTPDFFGSNQTPSSTLLSSVLHSNSTHENNSVNEDVSDKNLINSPSTDLQSYTHHNHSPFSNISNSESYADHLNSHAEQPFELLAGNDLPINSSAENNPSSTSTNNQVDSFIDYNSGFI